MEFVGVAILSVIVWNVLIKPRVIRIFEFLKQSLGDRLGIQYASAVETFLDNYWVYIQDRPEVLSLESTPLGMAFAIEGLEADQMDQMFLVLSTDKRWKKQWAAWAYPDCPQCGGVGCTECRGTGHAVNPIAFMGIGLPDYDGNSGNPAIHRILRGAHNNLSGKHPVVQSYNKLVSTSPFINRQ